MANNKASCHDSCKSFMEIKVKLKVNNQGPNSNGKKVKSLLTFFETNRRMLWLIEQTLSTIRWDVRCVMYYIRVYVHIKKIRFLIKLGGNYDNRPTF